MFLNTAELPNHFCGFNNANYIKHTCAQAFIVLEIHVLGLSLSHSIVICHLSMAANNAWIFRGSFSSATYN